MKSSYISLTLILILIIVIVVVIKYIDAIYGVQECFVNNPITISENILNITDANKELSGDNIVVDGKNLSNIVDNIKKTNKLNRDTIKSGVDIKIYNGLQNRTNLQLIIDPYINYYVLNNSAPIGNYRDGIFVCLSNKILREEDCIWDIKGKVIAYLFMSDYLFIQALIKGYNLDIKDVYLKKITYKDFDNTDKIFDYLFTYMVIDSEYMNFICGQKYFINGIKDVDINRIKAYYPFIKENYNTVKFYYSNSKKANLDLTKTKNKDDKNNNNVYVSSVKTLLPIMRYNIISSVENFITRLEMPHDYLDAVKEDYYTSDKKDKNSKGSSGGGYYGCYGNSEIKNKFECDSYYNIDGTPKAYYSLWDKRCAVDEDCPYYKANINYPNNRGGCISGGFCEFPVGVKRLGYTKYTDTNLNTPMCYNCNNPEDKGIPPNKPDYVFDNDFNEREKYKLNTIITLLDYRGL
jgi:hypothetical protein